MQVRKQSLDNAGADISFGHQLPNAGESDGNKRKLRSREKTVERHERQHTDQPHREHDFLGIPYGHCNSTDAAPETRVPSLHTRDGDKDIFSAECQLDAAVLRWVHFQTLGE